MYKKLVFIVMFCMPLLFACNDASKSRNIRKDAEKEVSKKQQVKKSGKRLYWFGEYHPWRQQVIDYIEFQLIPSLPPGSVAVSYEGRDLTALERGNQFKMDIAGREVNFFYEEDEARQDAKNLIAGQGDAMAVMNKIMSAGFRIRALKEFPKTYDPAVPPAQWLGQDVVAAMDAVLLGFVERRLLIAASKSQYGWEQGIRSPIDTFQYAIVVNGLSHSPVYRQDWGDREKFSGTFCPYDEVVKAVMSAYIYEKYRDG